MMFVQLVANLLRFAGVLLTIAGLWFAAGGLRVVVSGRVDERRRAAGSLKRGVPILIAGLLLLFGGWWLAAY